MKRNEAETKLGEKNSEDFVLKISPIIKYIHQIKKEMQVIKEKNVQLTRILCYKSYRSYSHFL